VSALACKDLYLLAFDCICAVAKQIAKLPFTPGHEAVGTIAAVGKDVSADYKIGARICVENHYYCGKCYQCTHGKLLPSIVYRVSTADAESQHLAGLAHICQDMGQFGHGKKTVHGGKIGSVLI